MRLTWTDSDGLFKDEVITIDLAPESAPIHVENFHLLATDGMYDNTQYHRVIDDFMIQGGDFQLGNGQGGYAAKWYGYCDGEAMDNAVDCAGGQTLYTIPDEADNGLIHNPCTISMAKKNLPNTGSSQFFLIPEDSTPDWLDGVHTVFGDISDGCEHVTSISEVQTDGERPSNPVTLVSVTTNGGVDTPWWYFW